MRAREIAHRATDLEPQRVELSQWEAWCGHTALVIVAWHHGAPPPQAHRRPRRWADRRRGRARGGDGGPRRGALRARPDRRERPRLGFRAPVLALGPRPLAARPA